MKWERRRAWREQQKALPCCIDVWADVMNTLHTTVLTRRMWRACKHRVAGAGTWDEGRCAQVGDVPLLLAGEAPPDMQVSIIAAWRGWAHIAWPRQLSS